MTEGSMAGEATARMSDGTSLRTLVWRSRQTPWAAVLLVHGIAEHAGRYGHVGAFLADAGIEVHAYDQRGFGGSGGPRADLDRWSRLHDDLEARLATVRGETRGLPLALYGHSLGGLVVTGYLLAEPARPLPDLAILSSPALTATLPAWKKAVARALAGVAPRFAVGNGLPKGGLSSDPEVEVRYLADPLVVTRTTTRFAVAAFREQERIAARLAAGAALPVPAFVFHGSADPIVPPSASAELIGHGDVTRRVFADHRHECHNEPGWRDVEAAVVDWLRARTGHETPQQEVAGASV